MLEERDGLGAGVGLGAFRLLRLARAASLAFGPREEAAANMPLGRVTFLEAAGLGWATTVMVEGLTNMPKPILQSK
jgi:hypothetical protein